MTIRSNSRRGACRVPSTNTKSQRPLVVLAFLLVILVAGCFGPGNAGRPPVEDPDGTASRPPGGPVLPKQAATSDNEDATGRNEGPTSAEEREETGSTGHGNNSTGRSRRTGDQATAGTQNQTTEPPKHVWPPIDQATIRPGANIHLCTVNFVFLDNTTSTVFLGTAAHCVQDLSIGDPIEIYEGEFPEINGDTRGDVANGTLAYAGWWTGERMDRAFGEDFALIAVDPEHEHKVHPAVRHWGGPTALRPMDQYVHGERVLWYGSSGTFRQQVDALEPNEGYACRLFGFGDYFSFYPVGPIFTGDSGSPVMAANGEALGVVTNLGTADSECGSPSAKGSWLQTALEEANERGLPVELATWELLETPRLPPWPLPFP